jgi:hypothetical protein
MSGLFVVVSSARCLEDGHGPQIALFVGNRGWLGWLVDSLLRER